MRRNAIGRYHHRSGSWRSPRGRERRLPRPRRRFPYFGLVPAAFGLLGPLLAVGVALCYRAIGAERLLRERWTDEPLPPAPSLENVLFGAGLPEVVLASALFGAALWAVLWRPVAPKWGVDQCLGAALGAVLALAGGLIGALGLYIRTGPAEIPIWQQPLFAVAALSVVTFNALLTLWAPLTLVGMGVVGGALTSVVVDWLKPRMPIIER